MTRIIAGDAKGRLLEVPKSGTRPTSDKVREALFSYLDQAGYLDETVVLDLFAGSGALGLEAASRGARSVTLVENSRGAIETIHNNIAALGMGDRVSVAATSALHFLARPRPELLPVDLVLIDPPYGLAAAELDGVIAAVAQTPLASDALVVVERDGRSPAPTWPDDWRPDPARTYGGTMIWSAGP